MRVKSAFLMVMVAFLLGGCNNYQDLTGQAIQGSGKRVTENRTVSGFSQIVIQLGADLALTQGTSESLSIDADDNLMPYIISEVRDGQLIVRAKEGTSPRSTSPIKLAVSFRALNRIDVFGASNITSSGLNLDTLAISFAGTGSTQFSGTIGTQSINISGQATIKNFDVTSQRVSVSLQGAGTVQVTASDTLDVTINGAGSVFYQGNPKVNKSVNGIGQVTQKK